MGQDIIMTLQPTFGPLQSKEIALGARLLPATVGRSLHGLELGGEVSAMKGHGRRGGTLVFWEARR
jgi:hypothetical protein